MRKVLFAIVLALTFCQALGQQNVLNGIVNGDINTIKSFYNQVGTSDDKANFANILTAVAKFSGISDNGLSFKANLYQISTINHNWRNSADYFSTHPFLRNFEVDLGGTPDNNNVLQYTKGTAGITYAIFNNNTLRESDYNRFVAQAQPHIATLLLEQRLLATFSQANPQYSAAVDRFFSNDDRKNTDLPPALLSILTANGITDPAAAMSQVVTDFKESAIKAKARTLLTFSPSLTYDGTGGWVSTYGVKANYTFYEFIGKMKLPWAFSFQPSYNISKDTIKNTTFANRKVFGGTFSIDITPIIDKSTYKAVLEVKPQIGYTRTNGELFKDEKVDQWDFMTTVSYTVSKDLTIPIAFKITHKDPTFFGFLSIQYSL